METSVDCEHDDRGAMEAVVAFLELFRGVSGIRLRTPPGAHLERPERSLGAFGELHCGRLGAHFPGSAGFRRFEEPRWNEFVPQLSSTHNSKRSTQLNSTPNSTQLSLSHQLNLEFDLTQVTTDFNSANHSTQLNSNQLTTKLNAIRNLMQLNQIERNATRNTTQLS